MIGSILVLTVSLILFLYWFRYTCLLVLSAKPARDFAPDVAAANQLSFPAVRAALEARFADVCLPKLEASLERDFRLLNLLIRQASELPQGGLEMEEMILLVDYRIMRVWYTLTRPIVESQARRALREMSDIVAHFAHLTGERQALPVAAQ